MANGDVQNQIASGYLTQFNRPLAVSAVLKLQSWSTLQNLGYNGQLSYLKSDFHGLQDFKTQMSLYSSSHIILTVAWNLIKSFVLNNLSIVLKMFVDPVMGQVGSLFRSIANFGQVFSASPSELMDPSGLATKSQSYASQAASLAIPSSLSAGPVNV